MFEPIDLENTSELMLARIEANCEEAHRVRKQIRELEVVPAVPDKIEEEREQVRIEFKEAKAEEQEDDEMQEIIHEYRQLDDPDREMLLAILPDEDSYEFEDVVYRLLAESLREIKEMTEIQQEVGEASDSLEFIRNERQKIALLQELLEEEEEMEEQVEVGNNIILAPNKNGKIFLLDDLDRIPVDYYDETYELIQSIIRGEFKRIKRFNKGSNQTMAGVTEVRGKKVRIVFQRLNHNTYALFAVFLKKTMNDKGYQEFLKNRISEYKDVEEFIKSKMDDEEFQKLNETYLNELWNKLGEFVVTRTFKGHAGEKTTKSN